MALDKNAALLGIDTGGNVHSGGRQGGVREDFAIVRNGDSVKINNEEEVFVKFLVCDPLLHGAQVVAEVQRAGRLNAG